MSARGNAFARKFFALVLSPVMMALFCLLPAVPAAAQTTLSATTMSFGNVVVGTTSVTRTVTLKNTGATSITIDSLVVTASTPYTLAGSPSTTCGNPGPLAAGASCTVGLTLSPTALGAQPASTLTITTTASNPTSTVTLSGTGVNPTALSAASLAFGNVVVGTASAAKSLTLYNYQLTALTINSITPPANYAVTGGSCPSSGTLAASSNCTISLTVTPPAIGAVPAGSLTVATNASNSPVTASLTATGVNPTALSAATLAFGNVVVGTASAAKSLTLYNYQLTALTINSITPPANYAVTGGSCPSSGTLAASSNCTISLTVTPPAIGAVPAGSLTVATNASNSPVSAALTAAGVPPTALSIGAYAFGNVVTGTTSPIIKGTFWNYQLTPINISSLAVVNSPGSGFALDPSTTCPNPGTLGAQSSCVVAITLTPSSTVSQAGSLTITDSASNSPTIATLGGTGIVQATLSTPSNFGNVVEGQTSSIKLATLTNNLSTVLAISSIAATGTGYAIDPSTACPNPGNLAAKSSCTIAVTLTPAALGLQSGTLTVTDGASNSPQTVPLDGTGVVSVTLTPASLAFGNIPVSTTSTAQVATLKNAQASSLTITSVLFGGTFALDPTTTTCPMTGGAVSGAVAAGASCAIGVVFSPTTTGAVSGGKITVVDTAANSPQVATLTGTGVGALTITPSVLAFGSVVGGTTSAVKNVTVTNNQLVNLNFSAFTAAAPYAVAAPTSGTPCMVGTPLAHAASCTIGVTFSPTILGLAAASSLAITDDASGSPQDVILTGTGIGPVTLSAATLAFGTVVLNEPVVKNITLNNSQSVPLTINSITGFSGGYTLGTPASGTPCVLSPATVPAASSCMIAVSLDATTLGSQTGTITILDNAPGGSQTFGLSGTAIGPVGISPAALSFLAQYIGTTSAAKTVTLTNEQDVPLNNIKATITGTDPNDFAVTTTCPSTLPAASPTSHCTLSVTYTPTASGTRVATLSISDDAPGSPQLVSLYGPGNAPVTVTPGSITTFTANVGTTSTYKTVTVGNTDSALPLLINSINFSGDFIQSATTCPLSPTPLAGGATCTISVEFDPSIGGIRDGQIQINDNALTSPQVVNLSGTGTNPLTISPSSLSFSAQLVGTVSSAKLITLTNHEVQSETFTLGTSGDFTATSSCGTGVIAANSTCPIFVSFTPSSTTPTTRSGSLVIADSAAIGSPLSASLTGAATATNPPAAVSVVSPGAGSAGTAVPVVITGNGWTHFSSSSVITFVETTNTSIPCSIAVSGMTAPTLNTIDATLTLSGAVYGACNIKVVTPLGGGKSETASLLSAFTIADPTNAHVITSLTPAFGSQGQSLLVAIAATGTHFVSGTTFANFGDGITVNYLTVTDATDAEANITISNTTPVGYRTITMMTNGEFATSASQAFQVGPNSATLVSVSPNTEAQGWSGQVTVTATGSHFLQNATQVSIGGVIVGDVNVISPTQAVAEVAVPASAPVGPENVSVSTGGEIMGLNNAFTITGATPALLSVAPSSGVQGQNNLDVIITGNAFTTFNVGALSSEFTGEITVNSTTALSASQVDANISIHSDANVGSITANLINGTTLFPFTFTVTASGASIIGVTPSCVAQGGQVTLGVTGLNTIWATAQTVAAFYPEGVPTPSVDEITINSPTSASLAIAVPTNSPAGSYGFYLATGGQVVSASVNVCAATPTLTMSPANGLLPTGTNVNTFSASFTGQFTHFSQAGTLPVISGEGVTLTNFTVTGPTSATATVTIIAGTNGTPTATGSRLVTFTTGGEIVTTYFNVTQTPVGLLSISPYHAAQSVTLDVVITGLNTHFSSAGPTTVIFGGPQITINSVTVTDDTHLTANITTSYMLSGTLTATPPGWQTVYVNDSAEQLLGGFLVDSPAQPSLVSVCVTGSDPCQSSAAQGSTVGVTITGNLTNWNGTTEAILGAGVSVSELTITSPTTATATIAVSPTAPVGGNSVIMITGAQVVSGTGFSVTPSSALIYSVGPVANCVGNFIAYCGVSGGAGTPYVVAQMQTTTLNIVGVGTHWLQGETTLSFGPGVNIDKLTVSSPTTAQVQITVLSTSPVGFAPLTTYTDGETVTLQQAIDIEEGSPKLLAISPGGAQQGDTFNLQVLGRFTTWTSLPPTPTTVTFNEEFPGDITVNSVTVIDAENLIANVSVSPLSYVDFSAPCGHVVTVTTGSEQVSTAPILDNFCVQQGAEEITSVSPLSGIQGSTLPVTITGSATNFIQGVTGVSFGDSNFQVGQITVNSPTSLTVPVAITTSAATGFKTVTVSTFGQVASQQYSFTVEPGVGTLNEAIANQAEQGVQDLTVRLIGQYTHFDALSTATFGAGIVVNSVTTVSNTEVDANISIDPLSYTGGRLVTVTTPGLPCSESPANITYAFNGCTPGSSAGTGSEIVSANVFSIIQGPAIISSVTPNTGNEGQEVVFNITGSASHWAQNFTQFYISGGGSDLTINSVVINSATSATVDMSISPTANPGPRSIYMVTNGESLTDSGAFVVTGGVPVVTYLSPNSAQPGTTGLPVTINGLYTEWTQATTTVNFGPGVTVESYTVDDNTHITAIVDVGATCTSPGVPAGCAQYGYRTVVVQTGTQGLTSNFLVQAPPPPPTPYVWYENPSSGIPGQTLTITFYGANTEWNPGPGEACSQSGTTLTGFNADVTVNCFQVTSPTSALANVTISPTATASHSTLTLTTLGTASYGTEVDFGSFGVVIAQPTLSIVDPGSGMQGAQNLTVNIIGQFTAFDSTTTFSFGTGITVNGPPTILGPTIATQSISIDQLATLGGRSVVAYTPDAPANAQVVGGAGFSVTPSLALISAITPNTSAQGTTITVDVAGQNTHWNATTTFQFGAGIVVSSAVVNSATDATVTLVIPALAPEGPTGASAHTGGEIANVANGFVVTAGTPYLLSSGPGSVKQQGSAVFTILSQATQWLTNPPTVSYGSGIVLTNVNVTSNTSLTVDGFVQPTTNVGYRNLAVTSGTQTLGINNAVYVSPGPAVINSVSPNSGGQGVSLPAVQITGTNTHWLEGTTTLNFPDVLLNSFVVNSPTSITANITVNTTAPAGQYNVTATTLGEVATGINVFTVTQTQPELLAVVSNNGPQGWTEVPVTLTGAFTHFSASSVLNFGTGITVDPSTVVASSPTSLTANITVSPTTTLGYRNVSVTTGSEVVNLTNGFDVTVGPAAIVGPLSPANGGEGTSLTVTVTGSQTHFAQGVTMASFGGGIEVTGVTVIDLLHATVNITIPTTVTLGSYNVSLTTGGEVASILGGFTVGTGAAQLSVVSPPTGTQGLTLSVDLTGLFTHFAQATSVASFGAGITVNSLTVNNSTSAVANITISPTATIGSRNVTVTTGAEVATLTGGFSVLAGVPALLTASPGTAQAGTTANIIINGQFTSFQQGFTTVSFGSGITVNLVTVSSFTQLTANITVATNAAVGARTIQVDTLSQDLQLNSAFTVTAGTPVITEINPNFGNPGQTDLAVTIDGQYTNWVNGTTVANFGPGITVVSTAVSSPTALVATITIPSSTSVGPVDVTTTTGGEVENVPAGFTVQAATIPAPSLLSISPGVNAGGVPINSAFTIVFSQPMNRSTITTSTVEFWLVSNPSGWVTVPGAVTVDATGRVVTFTPTSLLAVNSQYYMLLATGIKDATGNAFPQYGYESFYTVDSANTTPATVLANNPPANATNVGTNVTVELEFSADMNQNTENGLTVMSGGTPVAGTWSWNAPVNCCSWGPGTLAYFTPTSPLAAGTVYTVSYGSPLADTAGNAITPGSFSFTTGAAADTTENSTFSNFDSGETNIGTNFAPQLGYIKPINPIDINTGTVQLYNADSGKYVQGTVTVAPNGLSATFTPKYPLLPDTYYYLHQSCGDYDMDGNYLNCANWYFTTAAATDTTPPTVLSVSPANTATSVPLNAQITVHFSEPIRELTQSSAYTITVTPSVGPAISGTANLASDLVTLTFVPSSVLAPGTTYTVQVSNYFDMAGNAGATFDSSFTTAASAVVINLSTGLNGSGQLITANNTNDANWNYVPVGGLPGSAAQPLYLFTAGTHATGAAAPLQTVGPGDTGWYGGWVANGPTSDWVTINPNSTTGNTEGVYSTTFNIPGPTVPSNLCLVGNVGIDDNGELGINGSAITGNISAIGSLASLNIPISSSLVVGTNTLSLGWGTTDNSYEAFRLGAVIETCGASFTGGLTLTSAVPVNNATSVATNTTITLTFNNALDPATVNSTTLPVMINWNSTQEVAGNYVVTGNQVVFTPDSPFPTSTNIWVGACGGPKDLAGDSAGNCYTQLTNFTTGTTAIAPSAPFQVMAFAPASNATNVGLRAPVTVTFNRSVAPGTINSNSANADYALFAGDGQSPWCGGGSYSKSQDNTTLSFNCYPLPGSTVMTELLNSNLTDWTGDPLQSFSSQFTTTYYDSNTNGSVITTRPGNGASGINVNQPITIYTNLPIDASTASSGIEVAQNNVAVPGTVAVLDNGYTLEFTPSSPWTQGALIQWWLTGSMLDSTYETPINSTSGYFYAVASTATLAPSVQTMVPSSYSSGVQLNAFVDLQFNTPLNASTITSSNIYLSAAETGCGGLITPVTYASGLPANEVRMVPNSPLTAGDFYYVCVETGLQSTTSVPATQYQPYFYAGTAADSTLPAVQSAVPFNGDTGVGVNVTPGVVLNKSIDPVSVNSNTFQVTNGGTPLAGGFYLNSTDTRVEFVPNAPLPANTNLTMSINGILDVVGHPLTFTSNFTTGPGPDFTAPSVVWSSVSSNESIPINSAITVQFSESMDVTTFSAGQPSACSDFYIYDYLEGTCIATTLSWSSNQQMAYLVPSAPLSAGRQYELVVQSGTDLAGNTVNGSSTTFYGEFTAASSAPTVIAFNPLSGDTVGTNAIIEAEFSGPIDPNTIGGVILTTGGSTVATSPSLGSGNSVLQLIPAVPLAPGTTYTMHIVGVKDTAGNAVATVANSFTTGLTFDINAATAINSDPANNTTVGTNVTPKIVFNKPLNPITVNTGTFNMYLNDTGQYIPATVTESTNGTEVTITPEVALLPNTRYHFRACCGFQDQDGNNGNGVDLYFWTNGGAVSSGPTVTVSPANNATAIPLNTQVQVSVSAPIDPTTWTQSSIQLLQGSTPVAGTGTLPNAQMLVFTPTSPLAAGTTYTVNVSGFTDANGNAVVPSSTTFTTGTVAATGGLTLTSTNIVNGGTVTSYTQPIVLTFSQILNPTTVNAATLKVMNTWNSNEGLAGTYAVSGNQVTFTPANPYPGGTEIYVGECGGPTDILGDVFENGGCYGQQLVYFFTPSGTSDTTPLTVMSVSPAAGATNVRPDVPVSVTFNKAINPYTVYNNDNNALLFAGQGLQDRGSITMSADNRTLTFSSGTLYTGTLYSIQLPAGGISDPSGNALASTFTSTFTTGTNPATGNGGVQAVAPTANATGVPTDSLLTLYLNRPVNSSTLPGNVIVTVNGVVYAGTVQATADNYEVQFLPAVQFPNGAAVQWWFSALGTVLDVYGDSMNGDSGTFYTVATVNAATAVPTVIAISPAYSSTSVPVNAEFDVEYSQPVTAASLSGNVALYDWTTATYQAVTITPASGSSTLVRVTPNSPLSPSTQYGICTNANVKGSNGVSAAGDCWATVINTVASSTPDTTAGTVTIGPPNGSTSVGTNAYVRFWLSKPVDITTINSTNITITAGGNPVPGTWSYGYRNSDVYEVAFSPVNPLPPSTSITVSVNPVSATSSVLDYAGNSFNATTSTFTTAALPDYSTPTATLDFAYGTSGIGTNASFTCLYSEAMDPSSITASNTYIYSYVISGDIPVTYTWASDLMSVTMTPTTPLYSNAQYYYYCGGAIDLTGNGMNATDAVFYTGNGPVAIGPSLVAANPPSGATGVPVNSIGGPWNNTSLMLLFNEPVSSDSMANITFTPSGGSAEPIAVYAEDGNFIADVQLPWALTPNTTYTFNWAGVTDVNGNPATGTTTSSFTTGTGFDWTNPTITAVTPATGTTTTGVNPVISMTFSELMNPVLITSTQVYLRTHNTQTTVPTTLAISTVGGVTVVTLTPVSPLAESTIYDLVYWPYNWYLYDVAGNPSYSYSFTESTFTTGTTAAVNGVCGSANSGSFSAAPSANLCSAGTASAITEPYSGGSYGWAWSCNGQYSGTNASCSATVTGAPACLAQSSVPGLVSLWPGNDNPNDVGPGGYNGTLENGVTYALGEVGDGFNLSGSDQYVLIGQPVPTNLQIQSAITMSAWVYMTALPTNLGSGGFATIMGSQDGSSSGIGLYIDNNGNGSDVPPGGIDFNIGTGSGFYSVYTTTQVPLNQWTLVTVTASANNPSLVYFNGVAQPTIAPNQPLSDWTSTTTIPYSASGQWFAIGQSSAANYPFTGQLNDVMVSNQALTQAKVQAIYNAGRGGVCQ